MKNTLSFNKKLSRLRKLAREQDLILRRTRGGGYELIYRQPEQAFGGPTLDEIETELALYA